MKEEDLLEELIFGIASWTKRKRNLPSILNTVRIEEFNKTFKKFLKSFFINGDNEEIPDYWKRAKTICSDFDVWILTLDPGNIDKKSFENIYNNLGSDKIYIFPNYACNRYLSTLLKLKLVI